VKKGLKSKVTRLHRVRRNGDLYFQAGKGAYISLTLKIEQCVLQKKSLTGSIKRKAASKRPKFKMLLKIFHF
jgi:hypothetical protein